MSKDGTKGPSNNIGNKGGSIGNASPGPRGKPSPVKPNTKMPTK